MFFISDINGNLVPVPDPHPEYTAERARAAQDDAQAETRRIEDVRNERTGNEREFEINLRTQQQRTEAAAEDAAVFDGPVLEADSLAANLASLSNVSSQAVGLAAAGSSSQAVTADEFDKESNDQERETERSQQLQPIRPTGPLDAEPTPVPPVRASGSYRRAMPSAERKPAITAEQIMSTPVVTLSENDTAAAARNIFHEHRFRHIPILSNEGKLIGIISDRDFIPPVQSATGIAAEKVLNPERSVRDLMTSNILTALPQTEIRAIAKVLFERRIGSMPIVNESGTLVGLLTRSDILRTVVNHAPLELWT